MARTRKRHGGRLHEPKTLPLMDAIRTGNITRIQDIFDAGTEDTLDFISEKNGKTPLTLAIEQGNIPIVKLLIEYGADPFFEDGFDKQPIYLAMTRPDMFKALVSDNTLCLSIYKGNVDILRSIIAAGNDVNISCDDNQNTPLSHAVSSGTPDMVQLILDSGANVNSLDITRTTPLHYAAYKNRLDILTMLISGGANANAINEEGMNPLHFAADNHFLDGIQPLISAGADINAKNIDGNTPLHLAIGHIDIPIVKELVALGADNGIKNNDNLTPYGLIRAQNPTDFDPYLVYAVLGTPLPSRSTSPAVGGRLSENVPKRLVRAVISGNIADIKEALAEGADINETDKHGFTSLTIAIQQNNVPILTLLTEHVGDMTDEQLQESIYTAAKDAGPEVLDVLKQAVIQKQQIDYGNPGMVTTLTPEEVEALGVQTFVNYLFHKRAKGDSPIHWAAMSKKADIQTTLRMLTTLLNYGVNIDETTLNGRTPLHLAALHGNIDIVRFLIERHANIQQIDTTGMTPLHFAAFKGFDDVVAVLLHAGADGDAQQQDGIRPLHFAVINGHTDVVRVLLTAGVDRDARQNNGRTPIQLALLEERIDIVNILIDAGADIHVQDSNGNNVLFYVLFNMGKNPDHEEEYKQIVRKISSKTDINIKDKKGRTPLHTAAALGTRSVVHFIIHELGANLEETDSHSKTALQLALMPIDNYVSEDKLDIASQLIAAGADINVRDTTGKTPLHMACLAANGTAVAITLIQKGADINAATVSDVHPIHLAVLNQLPEVVKLLIEKGADLTSKFTDMTPLELSMGNGSTMKDPEITNMLFDAATEEQLRAIPGKTSLIHRAAMAGKLDIIQRLVAKGIDINTPGEGGNTVLHFTHPRHKEVIDWLIHQPGIDLNAKNNIGRVAYVRR